ncbi:MULTISPECIES: ribonuclease R [unclassified Mycoplasma]|uniref:ribonuclease R n=1 Tax=unclassified Mycoplasma TaxID=2683645 RepID=UPI00211CF7D9|nr:MULTISPECIES: ribonuclease R [unclassified Mycoplasma]UUM19622.1 ribonuclease R [Mycoplasma sp. 1578d]UUM24591.1 ribonuclease R [Mycoplasma sp. 3686d]
MKIEDIYKFIKNSKSKSFLEIARFFKIRPKDNHELNKILGVLQKECKVFRNEKDEYYAPELISTTSGVFYASSKGNYGFVDYDIDNENKTKQSVFIKPFNFNGAITNDIVQVNIYVNPHDPNKLTYGVITHILERKNDTIIGFIKNKNHTLYFLPTDLRFKNCTWALMPSEIKYKLNDLVIAKILKYDGKIVFISVEKVITNEADPMVFVKAYLESIKSPDGFPSSLASEIHDIPDDIYNEDLSQRVDLRNKLIVTIDGEDTKDFDDAINVKKLVNGNWKLGVYIADVSYYVREDTLLDQEALSRGTSTYLVDRVIPMLPEKLSNGICSLNPNQDRFVLACEMEIDSNGKNVSSKIFPAIINSKFRLTYKQVNNFYKTGLIDTPFHPELSEELSNMLEHAKELSLIIHAWKTQQGYIDFEIDEPKIKLDEHGFVKDIIVNKRGFSEVLIEDFMVRANEIVAQTLFDAKLPLLYRVHEIPNEEKLTTLTNSLEVVNLPTPEFKHYQITPKLFADFVEKVKTNRDDDFVKLLFLRTMQKAVYSHKNIKHFGLASDFYCHFTSPIRRYPDLVIHRIIRDYIIDKKPLDLDKLTAKLEHFANLNTASEQKAVQVERKVNDLKFAEYLKSKIGQSYKAQIFSVLNFGFFVEFDFKASGLVHKSNLFDGDFELNENSTKLFSKTKTYTIGDIVEVTVINVDLVEGKVDCVLTSQYEQYLNKVKKG